MTNTASIAVAPFTIAPFTIAPFTIARVNGVALNDQALSVEELRQRASAELLRQAAVRAGLLAADDQPGLDGVQSAQATSAIEALLEQQLQLPVPSEEACQRHYAAHSARWRTGEKVHARHILFAVTAGVDVVALRNRAETTLLDVRCHAKDAEDSFGRFAQSQSNCPSGQQGGDLGWLDQADCAPEFAKELFGLSDVGVLPRLVHSRFGLHVVEVLARQPGVEQPYAAVRGAVAMGLQQSSFVTALRQYLMLLAGQARLEGVALDSADTPLVQ